MSGKMSELEAHVAPLVFWMAERSVKSYGCGILGSSVRRTGKAMCTKCERKAVSDVVRDQPLRALCGDNLAVITESICG